MLAGALNVGVDCWIVIRINSLSRALPEVSSAKRPAIWPAAKCADLVERWCARYADRDVFAVSRSQLLRHRRRVGGLTGRMAKTDESLRSSAWVGLQDSVPRAALLSLHARVDDIEPDDWNHSSLIGVWGPRFSAYVVFERDRACFTLGRLPKRGARQTIGRARRSVGVAPGRPIDDLSGCGVALGVDHDALDTPRRRVGLRCIGTERIHRSSGSWSRRTSSRSTPAPSCSAGICTCSGLERWRASAVGRESELRRRRRVSGAWVTNCSRCELRSARSTCSPPTKSRCGRTFHRAGRSIAPERRCLHAALGCTSCAARPGSRPGSRAVAVEGVAGRRPGGRGGGRRVAPRSRGRHHHVVGRTPTRPSRRSQPRPRECRSPGSTGRSP